MARDPKKTSSQIEWMPDLESLAIGALAILIVQSFRAEMYRNMVVLWIEIAVYALLPMMHLQWVARRKISVAAEETESRPAKQKYQMYFLQLVAFLFGMLPLAIQPITRQFGIGDPFEVLLLMVLQNIAWYLLVFSKFSSFKRTGFVLASAIVLFVCFTTERAIVLGLAFTFALIALWWLMGNYWSRLKSKAIDCESKTLPVRGVFIAVSICVLLAVAGIASVAAPSGELIRLTGFMPSSGGVHGSQSDYARSGIGDGNNLKAGDNARSAGAVDSDQFIEDEKKSMYDMMSEQYSAPLMKIKRRRSRSIALEQLAKHIHNIKQAEQAGRTFRTLRNGKTSDEKLDLEDRISKALFYVEGSVPARFAITTYHHFDGVDWCNRVSKAEMRQAPFVLQRYPVARYVVQSPPREFIPENRTHKIKIMRLESDSIPQPSLMKSWKIYLVDRKDMFEWGENGVVNYAGGSIPPQTLIDIDSQVLNYHVLRSSNNLWLVDHPNHWWKWFDEWIGAGRSQATVKENRLHSDTDESSPFRQIPPECEERLKRVAEQWTEGIKPGWNQVEAIIMRMRREFRVDPSHVPPEDCDDPIGYFLDEKSGPSYMFATTAAMLLRAAGYESRFASGFLIQKKDYVREAQQSIVTSENMHVWPEVRLEGWHWLPLEPTPTYPIPYSTQTVWQWVKAKIVYVWRLAINNPLTTLMLLILTVLAIRFIREIQAAYFWVKWKITSLILPRRALAHTRKLLDSRFRVAGFKRPQFALISNWYGQIEELSDHQFFQFWNLVNFSSDGNQVLNVNRSDIRQACQSIVSQITYLKIKRFIKTNKREQKK